MSVNKVILLGRVGKDPEIRTANSGDRIANLTLATSESWRDKSSGEKKEKTEWHRVVCFNDNLTRVIESYVKKGDQLYVEGAIQTRKWTDQAGVEKCSTEIVIQKFRGEITLLGSSKGVGAGDTEAVSGKSRRDTAALDTTGPGPDHGYHLDDEIPF